MSWQTRTLRPGDRVPDGEPRKIPNGRYVHLVWTEAPGRYVRVYEHRVRNGRVLPADVQVHHRDHNGHNNHPDNLVVLTPAEHSRHHRRHNHEQVLTLFADGKQQIEIAEILGMSTAQVSRALTALGVPRRPKGPNGVARRNYSSLLIFRKGR